MDDCSGFSLTAPFIGEQRSHPVFSFRASSPAVQALESRNRRLWRGRNRLIPLTGTPQGVFSIV